jgi:hypothetical protein
MATTDTYRYRGCEIVPTRQWANWCVSIYTTRADLPASLALQALHE